MNNLPVNLYFVLIFIFFQGFLVLLVVFLFLDKFFSGRKMKVEENKLKEQAYQEALRELENSRQKSKDLIKEAESQASLVISETSLFTKELKEEFKKTFQKSLSNQESIINDTTEMLVKDLRNNFNQEKISTLAGFDTLIQDFKTEVRKQISDYKDVVIKNSLDIENILKIQASTYIDEMKQKALQYDEYHAKRLKEEGFSILMELSKEFFSDSSTVNDHEDAVMKILKDKQLKEKLN